MYSHLSKPCIMITNFWVRRLHVQPVSTAIHHVHKDWGANLLTTAGFKQVSMSSCMAQFKSIQTATCLCLCVCVCVCVFLPFCQVHLYGAFIHTACIRPITHSLIDSTSLHGFIPVISTAPEDTKAQGYYEIQKFHADS